MPDIVIRPTRDSDDARQECEDLARAMRDQGFESEIEVPGAEEVALGFVDLVVQVTERHLDTRSMNSSATSRNTAGRRYEKPKSIRACPRRAALTAL
jgi:hypothetical protein